MTLIKIPHIPKLWGILWEWKITLMITWRPKTWTKLQLQHLLLQLHLRFWGVFFDIPTPMETKLCSILSGIHKVRKETYSTLIAKTSNCFCDSFEICTSFSAFTTLSSLGFHSVLIYQSNLASFGINCLRLFFSRSIQVLHKTQCNDSSLSQSQFQALDPSGW